MGDPDKKTMCADLHGLKMTLANAMIPDQPKGDNKSRVCLNPPGLNFIGIRA